MPLLYDEVGTRGLEEGQRHAQEQVGVAAGSSRYGSSSSATRSKIVLSGVLTGKPLAKDTSPRATFRTAKLTVLFLELMRLGT